jgi:hypothetical protein
METGGNNGIRDNGVPDDTEWMQRSPAKAAPPFVRNAFFLILGKTGFGAKVNLIQNIPYFRTHSGKLQFLCQ